MDQHIEQGQSMYELVVAIAVVALSLLAFVGLVIGSLSASNYTRSKSKANRYTQEAMEWLRAEKDGDWSNFYNEAVSVGSGGRCIGNLSWSSAECPIPGTEFERRMYFNAVDVSTVEVRVETTWNDPRGVHTSESSTTYTNWRQE